MRVASRIGPFSRTSVAIGVMAHNEAATIGACLRAILAEPNGLVDFTSVVVVASGCTDGTEDVVREIAAGDDRVRLLVEERRAGKANAINWFLRETAEPICVVVSADVILAPTSLTQLTRPLLDASVGMTGGRPVPTNRRAGVAGHAVHLLWELHHQVSLRRPKLGEAVAFRRMFEAIDGDSLVDEASIEGRIIDAGAALQYVPTAVIHNHGPETIRDYLHQRRRIHLGHLRLRAASGHAPATLGLAGLLGAVARMAVRRPEMARFLVAAVALEAVARIQASASFRLARGRRTGTWAPIMSSKQVVQPGHTLRAYHEATVELRLVPDNRGAYGTWWIRRGCRAEVMRALREADSVRFDGGSVRLRLAAGGEAVAMATARLQRELSGWTVSTPRMVQEPMITSQMVPEPVRVPVARTA